MHRHRSVSWTGSLCRHISLASWTLYRLFFAKILSAILSSRVRCQTSSSSIFLDPKMAGKHFKSDTRLGTNLGPTRWTLRQLWLLEPVWVKSRCSSAARDIYLVRNWRCPEIVTPSSCHWLVLPRTVSAKIVCSLSLIKLKCKLRLNKSCL